MSYQFLNADNVKFLTRIYHSLYFQLPDTTIYLILWYNVKISLWILAYRANMQIYTVSYFTLKQINHPLNNIMPETSTSTHRYTSTAYLKSVRTTYLLEIIVFCISKLTQICTYIRRWIWKCWKSMQFNTIHGVHNKYLLSTTSSGKFWYFSEIEYLCKNLLLLPLNTTFSIQSVHKENYNIMCEKPNNLIN